MTAGSGKGLERNAQIDLIRVVSMVYVIAVHISPKPLASHRLFSLLLNMVLLTSNSNFYMISGELNLKKKFQDTRDYRRYYVKKAITILFPYVAATLLLEAWNMAADGTAFTPGVYLLESYRAFMVENSTIHLWFMYPFLGLLVSAPFLAKMLADMSEGELNLLFGVGLAWNVAAIWLSEDLGIGFAYNGWFLSGWVFYFFLGYYCDRVLAVKKLTPLYAAGAVGLAVNLAASYMVPEHNLYSMDLSVAYILFAMALYMFLKTKVVIRNGRIKKLLSFVAKHAFLVYMLHWNVWGQITARVVPVRRPSIYFCEAFTVTFVISFAMAAALNYCFLMPVQRWMERKLLRQER